MKFLITEKQLRLIEEKLGLSTDVIELTKNIMNILKDGKFEFDFTIKLNNKNFDFKGLPIKNITLEVENSDKTTGKISIKEFYNEYGEKEYSCILSLILDFDNIDFDKIQSIITHEIHHLYDRIIKGSKDIYNPNLIKFTNEINIFYKGEKIIKEFINMVYLSLDEEVNARVQQLSTDLKNVRKENFKEEIKNTQPYIDSQRLMNYDINKLDELNEDKKQMLITKFSRGEIMDFNGFKKYFSKRFKTKGMKLYQKILKLSGYLYGLTESFIINEFIDEINRIPDSCFEINPDFGKELLNFGN